MNGSVFAGTAFLRGGGHVPCLLRLETGSLVVEPREGETVRWPCGGLVLEGAGNEDEYLLVRPSSPGEDPVEAVTLRDPAFNEALAARVPQDQAAFLRLFQTRHRKQVSGKWKVLLAAASVTVLVVVGGYWAINTWIADTVAAKMPVSMETKWGRFLAQGFLVSKKEMKEGPAFDAAQILFRRLQEAVPADSGYTLELHVVEDPMVNAFALPGGQVVLMTGLMKEAGSAEEVAGVLAHEIQHVLKRHVVKRLVQSLGWRAWFAVFFGGGDLSSLAFSAGALMELSYNRAQETEADLEGAKLLQKAGLPIGPLASFFRKLASREGEAGKMPSFISTHPESLERVKKLEALASTMAPAEPRPLAVDWNSVNSSLK